MVLRALLALLLLALGACADAPAQRTATGTSVAVGVSTEACVPPPTWQGEGLPTGFPQRLRLPDSAVVTDVVEVPAGVVVDGYVERPVHAVLAEFHALLHDAGLRVEREDDEGREAEVWFVDREAPRPGAPQQDALPRRRVGISRDRRLRPRYRARQRSRWHRPRRRTPGLARPARVGRRRSLMAGAARPHPLARLMLVGATVLAALASTVLLAGAQEGPVQAADPSNPDSPSYVNYTAPDELGQDAAEPSIGANHNTGAVLFQALLETLRVTFDDAADPPAATWEDVSPGTTSITTLDPILHTDAVTGRTFVSQLLPPCSI